MHLTCVNLTLSLNSADDLFKIRTLRLRTATIVVDWGTTGRIVSKNVSSEIYAIFFIFSRFMLHQKKPIAAGFKIRLHCS